MATRQQEIWMALAISESDGSEGDAMRRFEAKVRSHRGAFQIPRLDEAQREACDDQALHDTFAVLGFPGTLARLDVFDRAVERRRYELEWLMREQLLHPVIRSELWCRRCAGYPSAELAT